MPPASLSTFAVMIPGPTTARNSRVRPFQRFKASCAHIADIRIRTTESGLRSASRLRSPPQGGIRIHGHAAPRIGENERFGEKEEEGNRLGEVEQYADSRGLRYLQANYLGMTKNSARTLYLLIVLIVVLLDRWTKHVVAQRIRPLCSHPGDSRFFSPHPHREHRRGLQPFCRFDRTLENGIADRVFCDRIDCGVGLALEKPPRSHCSPASDCR